MKSLFFPPGSSFFSYSVTPRARCKLCPLQSRPNFRLEGGFAVGEVSPCVAVDMLLVVCRGHGPEDGLLLGEFCPTQTIALNLIQWFAATWRSTCTNTHTNTRISGHHMPCFINASRASHCASLPPPPLQCFPTCLLFVFPLSFQCNMSTHGQRGECWCVNPLTGVQIPATPKVRGDPNCNQFQEELRVMPTETTSR